LDCSEAEVKRSIFLPPEIRNPMLDGMQRTVLGTKGTARPSIIHDLYDPKALNVYMDLKNQIIGKTGTAEILYKKTIDAATPAHKRKHVWFAAIAYPSPIDDITNCPEPELVVIAYLRFGDAGKEAAPITAQIIKKWREIRAKHAPTD
jgi:cell division protein FtsI/penicillin-binding protein 2